jgi:hypothetical protein
LALILVYYAAKVKTCVKNLIAKSSHEFVDTKEKDHTASLPAIPHGLAWLRFSMVCGILKYDRFSIG